MPEPADVAGATDGELLDRVRAGDRDAFGVLFDRHQAAAHRLARQLVRGSDTDDLVAEAFVKVLQRLDRGLGPDVAFRAYLLTAVRRLHVDRVRAAQRLHLSDDMADFDAGVPFQDTAVDGFERSATARAFVSLPSRWQRVLWHLDVEERKPADVAPLLGVSANGVSALAYRAREGLRQAYLQMHLAEATDSDCRWTTERLGAHVRRGLAARESTGVRRHLDGCARCTTVYLELVQINSNLRGLLAPLLLAGAGSAGLGVGGAAGGSRIAAWIGRLRDALQSAGQTVGQAAGQVTAHTAMATGVAGTAAVAVTAVVAAGPSSPPPAPDTRTASTSGRASGAEAAAVRGRDSTTSPARRDAAGPRPATRPGTEVGIDLSVRAYDDSLAGTVRVSGHRLDDLQMRLRAPGRSLDYTARGWDCSRLGTSPLTLSCAGAGAGAGAGAAKDRGDLGVIEFDLTAPSTRRATVGVQVAQDGGRVLDRDTWSAGR